MSQNQRNTPRKPIVSRTRNRLVAARLLISAFKSHQLAEYEMLEEDEKVARVLGARRFEAMRSIPECEADNFETDAVYEKAPSLLRFQVLQQLRALEKSLSKRAKTSTDCLSDNTRRLGRLLQLDATQVKLVDFMVRLDSDMDLGEVASNFGELQGFKFESELAKVIGCHRTSLRAALSEDSLLVRSGLVDAGSQQNCPVSRRIGRVCLESICLLPGLAQNLLSKDFDFERVFAPFFKRSRRASLSLSQFGYLGDVVDVLQSLLAGALGKQGTGVQVLLCGPPGTGKTELAHALAETIGATMYSIAAGTPSGVAYNRDERLRSFQLAQQALKSSPKTLLLFDEIEDVFPDSFGFANNWQRQKGWTNELLETSPVPSIWITNSTSNIDDAYLRRFALVVEMDHPPKSIRRQICADHLNEFQVNEDVVSRIAEHESITPADLERTRRAMRLSDGLAGKPDIASRAAATILSSGPKAPTRSALLPNHSFHLPSFDPALINTSVNLDDLVGALERSGEGRLCLYGPPGTGKTAFAEYIADRLDRDLITVSASDWLNPYLGVTEMKMRQSFERAAQSNAVLFIDEADSFLSDRRGASKSWEVTQVNELLKRLEEARGIVMFATNAFDSLDPAVLRRLDIKAQFRPLNQEQVGQLFERMLEVNGVEVPEKTLGTALQALRIVDDLVSGDFAAACRRIHVGGQMMDAWTLVEALRGEVAARSSQRRTAIGFTAPLH